MVRLRTLVLNFSVGLIASGPIVAFSQDFPTRPIRIVTSAAGGGNDFMARLMAQWLTGPLGQQVIVENRTSLLAYETVAKAQPDGYSISYFGSSFATLPLLQEAPYHPVRDFAPISMTESAPVVVVVHPSLPVKSIKELIALAKAKPGVINYGSGTTGGAQHLPVEYFKSLTGVNIVRVAYKGSGPAHNALLAGEVPLMFTTIPSVMPHIKSGKLTALAISSLRRSALAPDLPTVAESGVPGYEFIGPGGMVAPAKTPTAIINRLNREIVRVLSTPEAKEKFLSVGSEATPGTPAELGAFIKNEMARLAKLIKETGITEK